MNILLDTHMLIWALTDSPMLSVKAREMILNPENEIFYSVISLWEIEIKHQSKPKKLPISALDIAGYCREAGYKPVQLNENSVFRLSELVRPDSEPPHKDPFDRMLICQAVSENMTFLTHDAMIKGYSMENIVIV